MEHPKLKTNGEQVMVMILKLIWQFILDMWKLQNQHLHQHANQLNLPNYCQAATSLYKQREQLPQAAQEALYCQLLETILDLPDQHLEHWVVHGHKYFNQQVKAAKQQAKLHTTNIHTLFHSPTQQSDDLLPP